MSRRAKLGKGVKRTFTTDELTKRTERIQAFNASRAKKKSEERNALEREKELVERMARVGVFVPIGAKEIPEPEKPKGQNTPIP